MTRSVFSSRRHASGHRRRARPGGCPRIDAVDDGAGHGAAGGPRWCSPLASRRGCPRARETGRRSRCSRRPRATGTCWRRPTSSRRRPACCSRVSAGRPELPRGCARGGGGVEPGAARRIPWTRRAEHHRRNARKRVREPAERSDGCLLTGKLHEAFLAAVKISDYRSRLYVMRLLLDRCPRTGCTPPRRSWLRSRSRAARPRRG